MRANGSDRIEHDINSEVRKAASFAPVPGTRQGVIGVNKKGHSALTKLIVSDVTSGEVFELSAKSPSQKPRRLGKIGNNVKTSVTSGSQSNGLLVVRREGSISNDIAYFNADKEGSLRMIVQDAKVNARVLY